MKVDDAVVVTGRVVRVCKGGIVNICLGDGQLLQTATTNVRVQSEPLPAASIEPARRGRPRKVTADA